MPFFMSFLVGYIFTRWLPFRWLPYITPHRLDALNQPLVMNILFIEDEKDLLETAIVQLERKNHCIFPAATIAEARKILEDESNAVNLVITDHRLPDGLGIQFAIEIQKTYPSTKSAIVSGCLIPEDIAELEAHGLHYFHKPLLYTKVVESIRKHYALRTYVVTPSEQQQQQQRAEDEINADADDSLGTEVSELPVPKKRLWGLFGGSSEISEPTTDS